MSDNILPSSKPERLVSLDAYRGTIMLLMASAGFGLSTVAKSYPDSGLWRFLGYQTGHVEWVGCSLWDLIQPAFMFMVGVALPFSIANRQTRGQTFGPLLGHAIWRGVLLVLIAVFLSSGGQTPSWAIFSTGWVTLMLAGFVAVVDLRGWRRWTFPMVVVGLNPITVYCLWQLMGGWLKERARTHFGQGIFESLGEAWVPALQRGFVLLVLWLIVWWMYRRKIFVRI